MNSCQKKLNVLLIAPSFTTKGGTQDYCRILKDKLDANIYSFSAGREIADATKLERLYQLFEKYYLFIRIIKSTKFDVVHINTSLDFKSIIRDSVLLIIAKYFKKNVIVTFHGWYVSVLNKLQNKWFSTTKYFLSKPSAIIVLAEEFKSSLSDFGIKNNVIVEKTFAPDYLFSDVSNNLKYSENRFNNNTFTVLFLSRILREKGVFIAIDSIHLLQLRNFPIKLVVAGDGKDLIEAKNYVSIKKIDNVEFLGFIEGELKKKIFLDADAYILPSFSEGMPISVIEAMATGLPIISRSVGGLNDFFISGKMGFLTESFHPKDYSNYLLKLLEDKDLRKEIGKFNYRYARETFTASAATDRLLQIYYNTCKSNL